jgi:hypothetical protein
MNRIQGALQIIHSENLSKCFRKVWDLKQNQGSKAVKIVNLKLATCLLQAQLQIMACQKTLEHYLFIYLFIYLFRFTKFQPRK